MEDSENKPRRRGRPIDPNSEHQRRLAQGYIPKERRTSGTAAPSALKADKAAMALVLQQEAQKYTGRMFEILAHIAETGRNDSARVSAAQIILDRGHGKVKTQTEERVQQQTRIEVILPNLVQVPPTIMVADVDDDDDDADED